MQEQHIFLMKLQDTTHENGSESQHWESMAMDDDDGDGALPLPSHEGGELDELLNMQQGISAR